MWVWLFYVKALERQREQLIHRPIGAYKISYILKFVKSSVAELHACAIKQGVALTGRNITNPPSRAASWWVTLHMRVLQTTTDDNRRQRPLLVWLPIHLAWSESVRRRGHFGDGQQFRRWRNFALRMPATAKYAHSGFTKPEVVFCRRIWHRGPIARPWGSDICHFLAASNYFRFCKSTSGLKPESPNRPLMPQGSSFELILQ